MASQRSGGERQRPLSGGSSYECAADHSLTEDQLAADVRTLAAAGSETRYEALRLITASESGVCVCELEPALGVRQGAVSQALSRLYSVGMVRRRKEGRWRY